MYVLETVTGHQTVRRTKRTRQQSGQLKIASLYFERIRKKPYGRVNQKKETVRNFTLGNERNIQRKVVWVRRIKERFQRSNAILVRKVIDHYQTLTSAGLKAMEATIVTYVNLIVYYYLTISYTQKTLMQSHNRSPKR